MQARFQAKTMDDAPTAVQARGNEKKSCMLPRTGCTTPIFSLFGTLVQFGKFYLDNNKNYFKSDHHRSIFLSLIDV